jgi:hypothetical protein
VHVLTREPSADVLPLLTNQPLHRHGHNTHTTYLALVRTGLVHFGEPSFPRLYPNALPFVGDEYKGIDNIHFLSIHGDCAAHFDMSSKDTNVLAYGLGWFLTSAVLSTYANTAFLQVSYERLS